ncbi:MAG: hypothetical protein ACKODT_06520 [Fluviibacter sp.]
MRPKFNRAVCLVIALMGLSSGSALAEPLPLVVPEAAFGALPRITGDTLNQRLMDQYSTIRIQLSETDARLPPDTPLLIFRQGIRLSTPEGRVLGILAVPVANGQTLSQKDEAAEIAHPDQPGVAWMRLQSLQQEVMRGDSVMTRTEAKTYAPPICKPAPLTERPTANPQVMAIVSQADMLSSGGDLLVLSGGCAAGLTQGSAVTLWRPAVATYGRKLDQPVDDTRNDSASVFDDNPAITRAQTPGHRVGSAMVVATYPDTAIIRIQQIVQAVQPGDLVRLSPSKTQP